MAAPVVEVDAVDVTATIFRNELRMGLNRLDFTLYDPASIPALGDTVTVDDPAWSGTVTETLVDDRGIEGHIWVRVLATNNDPLTLTAGGSLSDATNDYRKLTVMRTRYEGSDEVRGSLETFETGHLPGHTFQLTSATHGFTNEEFTIQEVEVSWLTDEVPLFRIHFGDAMVTLSVWVNNDSGVLPIDETKITDGAVTTPKIAANAITASLIEAGAVTAEKLAATLVLVSLLKTAESGRRVEISTSGITLYDASDDILVNIPTADEPVYVRGDIDASGLTVNDSAEFRSVASIAEGATLTAQAGVATPTVAPTINASVPSQLLTSSPPNPGHGICYDSAGGPASDTATYWLGANPESSDYVAHEFNATTGALIRSITKTGSITTVTATLGSTTHITDTAQATSGSSDSQVATPLTMPRDGTITKVAVRMAGYSGSCATRVALWNTSGTLLANSSTFTASSATFAVGNSSLYNKTLSTPYEATSGQTIWAGFLRTSSGDGFQWDRDNGSGKTTKRGDNLSGNMTGIETDTSYKPNVYITYTYEVDTTLEGVMGTIIGVARAGTTVFVLDDNGMLFLYNQDDLSYASKVDLTSYINYLPGAGLFDDGTNLIVTTVAAASAGQQVRFIKLNRTTGAYVSTHTATGAKTVNGAAALVRGGYYVSFYWVAITDAGGTGVYPFNSSTYAYAADRNFGTSATMASGITNDGTDFRGWNSTTPDTIWQFTDWTWTTESDSYWVAYAWYDDAGTTHITDLSPRSNITMRRRERLSVITPSIPTGGADQPNKTRIYMVRNSTEPAGGNYKLQTTDALTTRYLTTYDFSGAADSTTNTFSAGTPAVLTSATAGWSLLGDGTFDMQGFRGTGSSFPGSPASGDLYFRTDLTMWFYYNGTRWLCTCLHTTTSSPWNQSVPTAVSATTGSYHRWAAPSGTLMGGSDIWLEAAECDFYVASGGTALGASHSWAVALEKGQDNTNATLNNVTTMTINSGSSAVVRRTTATIDALLNNGTTHDWFNVSLTKTGTPGTFQGFVLVYWRYVAT